MIKLFRISAPEHINDLSGSGSRLYGGRWNHAGHPAVYTSRSRSLAALEFLVHAPMALAPENLRIAEIQIPDSVSMKSIKGKDLPSNWQDYPAPEQLADIGTKWLKSKSSLLFEIPSAVVEKEFNILINPLHPDIKRITFRIIEKFTFDSRLLRHTFQ